MKFSLPCVTAAIALLLLYTLPAPAKPMPVAEPMPPASIEEGLGTSIAVVSAEYQGYRRRQSGRIGYFEPPVARFRVVATLYGKPPAASAIDVYHDFHDGSPCLEPEHWRFNPSMMPEPGSRWLLILQPGKENIFRTYRGNFGRMPDTPENRRNLI